MGKKVKKKRSRFAIDFDSPVDSGTTTPDKEEEEVELFCYCRQPDSPDMIGCDFCDEWFHPACLSLSGKETEEITKTSSWMCPECCEREVKKKKKTKLPGVSRAGQRKRGRPKKETNSPSENLKQ